MRYSALVVVGLAVVGARISTARDTVARVLSTQVEDGGEGYVDLTWTH